MDLTVKLVRRDHGIEPPRSFVDHEYVIHLVHQGLFTLQVEGDLYRITGGDVIVIRPLTLHALRHERNVKMTVIHFSDNSGDLEHLSIPPVASPDFEVFETIGVYEERLLEIQGFSDDVFTEQIRSQGLTQCILSNILSSSATASENSQEFGTFPNWQAVKYAVTFIQQNFENPSLSVDMVRKEVQLSYSYFCNLFHAYTNDTVHSFINRTRIRAAKAFLLKHDKNVTQTAEACGFSSVEQLSKVFKKYEGYPPKRWVAHVNSFQFFDRYHRLAK